MHLTDIIFMALIAGLLGVSLLKRWNKPSKGRILKWKINNDAETVLMSNNSLRGLQRLASKGGILMSNDLVVVWAQNFLDYDVFYETVKENISDGIRYFYILDRKYVDSFRILLEKLYADFDDKNVVNESVDVVFIKSELTQNNFVLMATRTERETLLSSLIYDNRPIGWIKQSQMRLKKFRTNVLILLTQVATAQSIAREGDKGFFYLEDQIMDYSHALIVLRNLNESDANFLDFPIGKVIESVGLEQNALHRVINMSKRMGNSGTS